MSIKSPLNRQFGTQFDSVFDVVKSNPMYDKTGGKIPSLDLNFAKSKSLRDSRSTKNKITFSRASTGTYVGSDGLIKTSPVNLLTYSERFGQSTWLKQASVTLTPNSIAAPDGTTTATLYSISATTQRSVDQDISSLTDGTAYVFSIYIKTIVDTNLKIRTQTDSSTLFDGQILAADGWQRIQVPFTKNSSRNSIGFFDNSGNTGDRFYIWGAQLEEGSTATDYIPTGATISGAPRFDHDPVTGESLGLLIEESRTNLISYSEQFDQWTQSTGVTANTSISPDGSQTADTVPQQSNSDDCVSRTAPVSSGVTYTCSVYLKQGTSSTTGMKFAGYLAGIDETVLLDFDTESVDNGSVENAGNGWYRISKTVTTTGSANPGLRVGIGTGTVLAWGAQVEAGSFPTSYIPTTSGTVTRSPDIASIEGTNFSSWYNQSEGTVFSDVFPADEDSGRGYLFSTGSNAQRFGLNTSDDNTFTLFMSRGGATSLATAPSGMPKPLKTTISYQSGSTRGVIDGELQTLSSVIDTPNNINQVGLGCQNFDSTGFLNGHISRLAYFPTRLPDDKLKSITSKPNPYRQSIVYNITNSGGTFILRSSGTVNYSVSWNNDESYEESTSNTLAHTYTAGNYDLVVYSDGVYRPYFNNVTADANQITSVAIGSGAVLGTNLSNAWLGASQMTTFTCPFDVTSSVTDFSNTWRSCSSLTSLPLLDTSSGVIFDRAWHTCSSLTSFPLLDTSSGTDFAGAWIGCTSLTSFPSLDTSSGTNFSYAWYNCNNLTSFPSLNTSSGTNFYNAWQNCTSLTSFPLLDTSSGTNFTETWRSCSILADFPANMFDTTGTLVSSAFTNAWKNCALTAQSIENILVSLDTNGATGITLGINGGANANASTWSAAAIVAYHSLISKGWTITQNGTVTSPVITYGITNAGGEFNLRSTGTVDYEAEWGDGNAEVSTLNTLPHTYTAAGDYSVVVNSDGVYRPYFNDSGDEDQITSVAIGSGADLGTSFAKAWRGASSMTSFACPFSVTSLVTNYGFAWYKCSSLTSFPLLNTSSGTNFDRTWLNCNSLTSFPLLNTSSGTNFTHAWENCSSLTSFPANMFDTTGTLITAAFANSWLNCALTAQSIENILVSLDTNGATGITLGINGGANAAKTTWSAAAVTAYDNLIVKGWTISFNA